MMFDVKLLIHIEICHFVLNFETRGCVSSRSLQVAARTPLMKAHFSFFPSSVKDAKWSIMSHFSVYSLRGNQTGKNLPSIEAEPTVLASPMTFTITYDLDLQSFASYGRDLGLHTRSTVSRFRRQRGHKRTDRHMEGQCWVKSFLK